jgi:hypothetical protein
MALASGPTHDAGESKPALVEAAHVAVPFDKLPQRKTDARGMHPGRQPIDLAVRSDGWSRVASPALRAFHIRSKGASVAASAPINVPQE